jgi:hypothetical protein
MSARTVARVGDVVAEGFTDAEIDEILYAPGEPTSVARSTHGYTPLSYGRAVTILGSAYVVRPGAVILAVDEEGVWTRDCCVHEITARGVVDGVALVRATGVIGSHEHPRTGGTSRHNPRKEAE